MTQFNSQSLFQQNLGMNKNANKIDLINFCHIFSFLILKLNLFYVKLIIAFLWHFSWVLNGNEGKKHKEIFFSLSTWKSPKNEN